MVWGWRIPFVVGAIVAIVGVVIRSRLRESIMFTSLKDKGQVARRPAVDVLKELPGKSIMGATLWTMAISVQGIVFYVFLIAYLLALKVPSSFILIAMTTSFAFGWVLDLVGVAVSDVIGRRPMIVISVALTLAMLPFFFPLVTTTNPVLIIIAGMILFGVSPAGLGSATTQVLITESFPTKYRYSGTGLSVAFAGFVTGLLTVFGMPSIIVFSKGVLNAWPWIVAISAILIVPGLISTLILKETRGAPLT